MSREGAEAGDSLADDQILHLIGAFVGVERFTIREEARRFVVGNDSVAAHQLAGPGNRLAAFSRSERLGKRGMGVRQLAFGMQLRLAQLDDEGKLGDHHAALAKAFCTSKSRETVSWGREVLGGNGIVADYNVARFFNDAEALYSYEGTYQMQNLIVGKAITGHGAFV